MYGVVYRVYQAVVSFAGAAPVVPKQLLALLGALKFEIFKLCDSINEIEPSVVLFVVWTVREPQSSCRAESIHAKHAVS